MTLSKNLEKYIESKFSDKQDELNKQLFDKQVEFGKFIKKLLQDFLTEYKDDLTKYIKQRKDLNIDIDIFNGVQKKINIHKDVDKFVAWVIKHAESYDNHTIMLNSKEYKNLQKRYEFTRKKATINSIKLQAEENNLNKAQVDTLIDSL